jgi:hypothetical protein
MHPLLLALGLVLVLVLVLWQRRQQLLPSRRRPLRRRCPSQPRRTGVARSSWACAAARPALSPAARRPVHPAAAGAGGDPSWTRTSSRSEAARRRRRQRQRRRLAGRLGGHLARVPAGRVRQRRGLWRRPSQRCRSHSSQGRWQPHRRNRLRPRPRHHRRRHRPLRQQRLSVRQPALPSWALSCVRRRRQKAHPLQRLRLRLRLQLRMRLQLRVRMRMRHWSRRRCHHQWPQPHPRQQG